MTLNELSNASDLRCTQRPRIVAKSFMNIKSLRPYREERQRKKKLFQIALSHIIKVDKESILTMTNVLSKPSGYNYHE